MSIVTIPGLADNSVTDAILRNSGALTVVGRSLNSIGDPADITATPASDAVLRESGSTVGFGTIATGGIADAAISNALIRDSAALSVLGRASNSSGDVDDIAGTDGQVLRVSGTTLGFGEIATAGLSNNAVSYAKWQQLAGYSIPAKATTGTGNAADLTAGTNSVLGRVAGDLAFAAVATGQISDEACTYAKMQHVSAESRVLGRGQGGGGGDVQELTMGPGLGISGTALGVLTEVGTKLYRVGHTYAISGEIKVPSGDTDFIIPFFYSAVTGQTANIVKARHSINSGTSATVKLQRNGGDITGYTGITVNTTPSDTTQTQALSDNDEIALVVTAVSGTPTNMNFTIFIELTQ